MREKRTSVELIHEGGHAAEVEIDLHDTDESWSPTMSMDDALLTEQVKAVHKDLPGSICSTAACAGFETTCQRSSVTPCAKF